MGPSRWHVPVAVLLTVLAGCMESDPPTGEAPIDPDDGVTSLQVEVLDGKTSAPLSGVTVTLTLSRGIVEKSTDRAGHVAFNVEPVPACSLLLDRDGYRTGAVALDCLRDQNLRLLLYTHAEAASLRPTPDPGAAVELATGEFLLHGFVFNADSQAPLSGVRLRLDPGGLQARSDREGAFQFVVAQGIHTLTVDGRCWAETAFEVKVAKDTAIDVAMVAQQQPPGAASGVRATPGPGPGMVTVSWNAATGAAGYEIHRNGVPFHEVANSQAYGIPGASASDRFSVRSLDGCGQASDLSGEVSAAPLPGPAPMMPTMRSPQAEVSEEPFGVLDLNGTLNGTRPWRVVLNTGNCCENYLTTTPSGRILDQGGSLLAFSDDEGRSWQGAISPLILLAGEGSVTPAPDGDIVAFDWATYNGDTAFAYRYSAATKTWHTQPVVVEAPAYDRPWIAVIKGPFTVGDLVVPYVSVVEGGIGVKDPLLVSLDGLTYVPSNSFTTTGGDPIDLRGYVPAEDGNRDWLGPMSEFGIVPLDNGIGIMERQGAMRGSVSWSPVQLPQIPGEILRVDSLGTWHSAGVDGNTLSYHVSRDGGGDWDRHSLQLPEDWSVGEWDFRVSAELDQAVFAVNADVGDKVQQAAVRFTGLGGTPTAHEILLVGKGDGAFGSGVGASGNRFDFMTLGFLPDGRIVMSAGDARDTAPFVAIEL